MTKIKHLSTDCICFNGTTIFCTTKNLHSFPSRFITYVPDVVYETAGYLVAHVAILVQAVASSSKSDIELDLQFSNTRHSITKLHTLSVLFCTIAATDGGQQTISFITCGEHKISLYNI